MKPVVFGLRLQSFFLHTHYNVLLKKTVTRKKAVLINALTHLNVNRRLPLDMLESKVGIAHNQLIKIV